MVMDTNQELQELLAATDRRVAYYHQLDYLKEEFLSNRTISVEGHVFIVNLSLLQWAERALKEFQERGKEFSIVLDHNDEPILIKDIEDFYETIREVFYESLNQYYHQYSKLKEAKTVEEIVGAV